MSDTVQIVQIIAYTVGGAIGTYIAYMVLRLKQESSSTHALVNSSKGVLLRQHAVTSRALAAETGKPADMAAAARAEQESRDHDAGQAKADRGET